MHALILAIWQCIHFLGRLLTSGRLDDASRPSSVWQSRRLWNINEPKHIGIQSHSTASPAEAVNNYTTYNSVSKVYNQLLYAFRVIQWHSCYRTMLQISKVWIWIQLIPVFMGSFPVQLILGRMSKVWPGPKLNNWNVQIYKTSFVSRISLLIQNYLLFTHLSALIYIVLFTSACFVSMITVSSSLHSINCFPEYHSLMRV